MTMEHAPLEAVYIYFGTATYDEIQRDKKVTDNMARALKSRICSPKGDTRGATGPNRWHNGPSHRLLHT